MGLFSPKTTIQVASTVYNMAGDALDRPNFLKTIMFAAVLSPYTKYLGETIVGQYLSGSGIRQRLFQKWCIQKDFPGLPTLKIRNEYPIDPAIVAPEITPPGSPAGLQTRVTEAFITSGDYRYFTDQYVYATYPALVGTAYLSEYYVDTNEILIQYVDTSTEIISAGIYDVSKDFVVAYHYFYLDSDIGSVVTGTTFTGVTDSGLLPNVTGYTLDSTVNTGNVTYTFVDLSTEDYNGTLKTYSKTEYIGGDGITEAVVNRTTTIYIWEYRYVVTGDHLEPMYDHRTDYQDETLGAQIGDAAVFIYELGTGNTTLDPLQDLTDVVSDPEFYPIIPIRLNNMSIFDPTYDSITGNGLYKKSSDAYKRMSGGQVFSKLVEEIEANPDIGDIDYAYIQYGVSFNDNDMTAGRYLYDFFQELIPYQNTDEAYMTSFVTAVGLQDSFAVDLAAWTVAQADSGDPLYGTTKPTYVNLTPPEITTIQLKCDDPLLSSSDMRISWVAIIEDAFTGIGRVDARRGDVWKTKETGITFTATTGVNTIEKTFIYRQTSVEVGFETYSRMTVYGMIHQNFIYGGKYVQISAHEAIDDTGASGFLVPLHAPTLKAMGMVDLTQLAMSNTYLVFNSYQVTKTYWYQTFLGQLLIIILVVVISVLLSPAAFAGVTGVFGTNLAVGVGLGLAGTAAIVAGAVANTLAAILISTALSEGSKMLFGDKWGSLIGAIMGFAFNFGMSGGFQNLNSFFNPNTLLQFGNALANGMQGFAAAEIQEMALKTEEARIAFEKRKKEIEELSAQTFGSDLSFDPMSLMDTGTGNDPGILLYRPEDLDGFIQRTLMNGTDMVELSLGFIENFTKISLTLPEN